LIKKKTNKNKMVFFTRKTSFFKGYNEVRKKIEKKKYDIEKS
jgi:hypothetical protein